MEICKQAMDAVNRGAFRDSPRVRNLRRRVGPRDGREVEGLSFHGLEGLEVFYAHTQETWEHVRVVGDDFRDLGNRVLMLGRLEGRGMGSGVPVRAFLALIFDLRGDKVSRVRGYLDRDEALQAVGLEE